MLTLYDTIRRIVHDELAQVRTAELAIVQDQHPHAAAGDTDNFSCTVRLRDGGLVLSHVPVATPRIGEASIPGVGELVLVQFVGRSMDAPVIVGRLYNDQDRPPPNEDARAVLHLPLGAADSDAVHVELQHGDNRQLTLLLGSGLSLVLHDDDPVVELSVDGGKATLTIARDGAVTVESQGALTLKGNDVKLQGSTVSVESDGQLTLKGATVNIN